MKKILSLLVGISIILSVSAISVLAADYAHFTKNVKVKIQNTSSSAYTNIYDVNGRIKKRLLTIKVEKGTEKINDQYWNTCGTIAWFWPDQKRVVEASGNTSYHSAVVWDSVRSMGISGTLTCNISLTKSYTITNDDYE